MSVLRYEGSHLVIGQGAKTLDLQALAERTDGPFYVYDLDHALDRARRLKKAFTLPRLQIHYAAKANGHPLLLQALAAEGIGVDAVSGGEVREALEAGVPADRIIFSGVAKTRSEIDFALEKGVKQINVESPAELRRIAERAKHRGQPASVAFRMNPDVNAGTHPYITTGFRENKFGMDESFLPELLEILRANASSLQLCGLTMHIGSQLLALDALGEALQKTKSVYRRLQNEGFPLGRLDIGGGLGLRYETADESAEMDLMQAYGRMVSSELADLDCEVQLEPGRIIIGRAGVLVGEIQYIKTTPAKTFAILNTGMHHLMRPALYQAYHRVLPLRAPETSRPLINYDVVGPICESSDFLAKDRDLPELRAGEFLAIADAGAYGFTMASRYNSHDLPKEYVVSEGRLIESL